MEDSNNDNVNNKKDDNDICMFSDIASNPFHTM